MIRVRILADSPARARSIADLLAEEDRIEVLSIGSDPALADVIIAAGAAAGRARIEGNIVFLTDSEPMLFETHGRAWLSPNTTAAELIAAVVAAAQDLTVLTYEQARRHLPGRSGNDYERSVPPEHLTNREEEVLRMLANGLGNKEVAAELRISAHTVKFHVAQILAKLGAGSRTEAVMIAIRRGLVPI